MDALAKLEKERGQVLSRIAEAARNGKAENVMRDCTRLEQIESLIHRYAGLVDEIDNLARPTEEVNTSTGDNAPTKSQAFSQVDVVTRSSRAFGSRLRKSFVEKLSRLGIELRQGRGTIHLTPSGSRVGIAVATERRPDRWFLGLPVGSFDQAVLLCYSEAEGVIEICLPPSFFSSYGDRMSKSNGQMKFNVARRGKVFNLLVPGSGDVGASEFLGKYSSLR
jgi:hypothetical protein